MGVHVIPTNIAMCTAGCGGAERGRNCADMNEGQLQHLEQLSRLSGLLHQMNGVVGQVNNAALDMNEQLRQLHTCLGARDGGFPASFLMFATTFQGTHTHTFTPTIILQRLHADRGTPP